MFTPSLDPEPAGDSGGGGGKINGEGGGRINGAGDGIMSGGLSPIAGMGSDGRTSRPDSVWAAHHAVAASHASSAAVAVRNTRGSPVERCGVIRSGGGA